MTGMFAVTCWDEPGVTDLRAATRETHSAHIAAIGDDFMVGGPISGADGVPIGSLMILRAADEAAVRKIVEADPYRLAGVWQRYDIIGFKPANGVWVGGRQF